MGTGNFYQYDARYIYVPKAFRDMDIVEDEHEINIIYHEAHKEVYTFLDKLDNILKPLIRSLEKRYKNIEIVAEYKDHGYDRNSKAIYGIDIYLVGPRDAEFHITILKVPGYYWGFSIDYAIKTDGMELPLLKKISDIMLSKIETLLYKSFDKYGALIPGGTWYKIIEGKRRKI